ncbi:polysaccharide pyruvyl transferase family protein [Microcoleus sp. D2_18a_D3]|uniref:polysaccharide pyruvyl transferase family protein n=1 Tax=Microcoleus sp. D2_18a_D3 TaxID=3055330 RepID=UPI002FD12057
MKIILFDAILETHACESLAQALTKRGHSVHWTGKIWKGHEFPKQENDISSIWEQVNHSIDLNPDIIFNFRASTLLPEMLIKLKEKGIHTIVWLPDDPVLYHICYRHVVDFYDTILHCGDVNILNFYEQNHGRSGFNFPFWTDQSHFPFSYNPENADYDVVFLGNCIGKVRQERYRFISNLPFSTKIFGKVSEDPFNLCGGFIEATKEVSRCLGGGLIGLNIPQYFKDYHSTDYDFPELANLGHFQYPSRIIQYAACGVPIISLQSGEPPGTFPELITASNISILTKKIRSLINNIESLRQLSCQVNQRFIQSFSAESRAIFLEKIIINKYLNLDNTAKAELFSYVTEQNAKKYQESNRNRNSLEILSNKEKDTQMNLPTIEIQRENLQKLNLESPRKFKILYFGHFANGDTDIVACLLRSLRNLGHTVLHINPWARHSHILRNRPKTISGYGAVFIDLPSIEVFLNNFQPEVIICCAGGLCFEEADSQELKSRGILLIALTLSDPDIQSSMINYVSYFDYHTTNSELALNRYNEAGINNTFLFPFGIDRSYINAQVEYSPEHDADVICLGHATNRPERQELMAYLADKFKVKVYGNGWQLPNSKTVRGYEMLQASRSGRIHINFAQTRAGYTNIKCGVFESIASGAVLCTTEFTEMKKYFEYGSEIIGFNSKEDITQQIENILQNPAKYEAMRRRSFYKLANKHLYEHRWLDLFNRIESDIFEKSEIISEERAKVLRKSLDKNYNFSKKVIISGFYGAGNTGDELILRSISQGVIKLYPHIQFFVASNNPQKVESMHALQSFERNNLPVVDCEISSASATLLGGGGLWHDYTFLPSGGMLSLFSNTQISLAGYGKLPLLGCIYNLPFYVFGMGVGPLINPDAQKFLSFLAKQAEYISVRDKTSLQLLEKIIESPSKIEYFPDPVFALDISKYSIPDSVNKIRGNNPILGVNLRHWKININSSSFQENLANALQSITQQYNCILLGIPMQNNQDEAILDQVFAMIESPQPKIVLKWTDDFSELFGALKACDGLVSMRLHSCLLAHRLGIPTLGLAYDPKVSSHFEDLGIENFSVSLDVSVPLLVDKIKSIMDLKGDLPESVKIKVRNLESQSREGIKVIGNRLNSALTVRNTAKIINQIVQDTPAIPKVIKLVEKNLSCLSFASEDNSHVLSSAWYAPQKDPKFELTVLSKDKIKIDLKLTEPDDKRYITTADIAFNKPPKPTYDWEIKPSWEYYVYLKTDSISGNVRGILWFIQYSETERLKHTTTNIKNGETQLQVLTHSSAKYFRVAIRLTGNCVVNVEKPTIYEVKS